MVPYAAGGYLSVLDGVFECISGLSGTGATVIPDLEIMPQGIFVVAVPDPLVRRPRHHRHLYRLISSVGAGDGSYVQRREHGADVGPERAARKGNG